MSQRFDEAIRPVLDEITSRCTVSDSFIEKEAFRIYVATLWVNAVANPEQMGIEEAELEPLHDYINDQVKPVLGPNGSIRECFEFLSTKQGEDAMDRLKVNGSHRDGLRYFATMIVDPDGYQEYRSQILGDSDNNSDNDSDNKGA